MERTLISRIIPGTEVKVQGFVERVRNTGAMAFLVLRDRTGLPIMRSDDPFTAVVYGAGKALDDLELLRDVSFE